MVLSKGAENSMDRPCEQWQNYRYNGNKKETNS